MVPSMPILPDEKNKPLRYWVEQALEEYFQHLDDQHAKNVYDLVIKEAEIGLLNTVMRFAKGNQSKAANWLGIARGTLRKRLAEYGIE